ncbi:MAG: hypothetical protein ACRC6I_03775 [Paracoccaceae bacterium]
MTLLQRSAFAVILSTIPASWAAAQDLEALSSAEAALEAVWQEMPITFRNVAVVNSVEGFGVYEERPDAVFKAGEPIVIYAEPLGYGWKDNGDGTYTFGFAVDLQLKTADGTVVAGQEDFLTLETTTRAKNKEFQLTLTLNADGVPPGEYTIEYTTRDIASEKSGTISVPIEVVE